MRGRTEDRVWGLLFVRITTTKRENYVGRRTLHDAQAVVEDGLVGRPSSEAKGGRCGMKPSWKVIGGTYMDSVLNNQHKHCCRELGRVRGEPFRCAPVGACSLFPTCRARTRPGGTVGSGCPVFARNVSMDCPVSERLDCSGWRWVLGGRVGREVVV